MGLLPRAWHLRWVVSLWSTWLLSSAALGQTLPPIPAGVPTYFSFGLFNASISNLPAGVPFDYRYQYLSGGVNTGNGWYNWNPNGAYVTNYIADSGSRSMRSAFIYYQIL